MALRLMRKVQGAHAGGLLALILVDGAWVLRHLFGGSSRQRREAGPSLCSERQRRVGYLRRAPGSMSSAKVARTGLPLSPAEAARSMPWDSRPRILRGARLVMTTILRPTRDSGGYHSAMPERIWRWPRVGPRSTSRRRSLSALGMRSATRILATRSSILAKSSMVIWGTAVSGVAVMGAAAGALAKTPEGSAWTWDGVRGRTAVGGGGGADLRAGIVVGEAGGAWRGGGRGGLECGPVCRSVPRLPRSQRRDLGHPALGLPGLWLGRGR